MILIFYVTLILKDYEKKKLCNKVSLCKNFIDRICLTLLIFNINKHNKNAQHLFKGSKVQKLLGKQNNIDQINSLPKNNQDRIAFSQTYKTTISLSLQKKSKI